MCGWANASLPKYLYKWECSPTSQIGSVTPQDGPVIPAFYTRPAIITRHSACHTLPTYTRSRQLGPPSSPMHTWVHILNNNVGSWCEWATEIADLGRICTCYFMGGWKLKKVYPKKEAKNNSEARLERRLFRNDGDWHQIWTFYLSLSFLGAGAVPVIASPEKCCK